MTSAAACGLCTAEAWDTISSIVTVCAASAAALLALGCVWPPPRRHRPGAHGPTGRHCELRSAPWPMEWTCTAPTQPFTLTDAHRWMQLHRDHTCARKRAAFAALVAAGRIAPDSSRPKARRDHE
ncbi:hypothetical protein [Nocardia terpenica]|uniref:Uncharacterized protein n=1 Tax=Nocardia terpenica TaxID=455432 RepID=A0A6G9YZN2_9NOCA|nr:hypothetical protein [Nocardia terpenica]QIS18674.1 hypothetical protein F6W96_10615 [Nocardia terpenica]